MLLLFFLTLGCCAEANHGRLCFADRTITALAHADSIGLYRNKYLSQYTQAIKVGNMDSDKAFYQLVYAILQDASYGENPGFRYNGLRTEMDSTRISRATEKIISGISWPAMLQSLEPDLPLYRFLKASLRQYIEMERNEQCNNYKDMATRLRIYGMWAGVETGDTGSAIKNFQMLVDLDTTGVADATTIKELAVPLSIRINTIRQSLNDLRWINQVPDSQMVLVNIPAACLMVINKNSYSGIAMKVILGKVSWQTPVFAAYIEGITTYPYWIIPKSIAVKEILPKVKYNPGLLEANNIQVLDSYGRIISSGRIAWRRLSSRYFPYTLRQSTGCDNSLGVMMFNINSPYSIFLHDTNAKDLFNERWRFLSHGCIRVENALTLAEAITGDEISKTTINRLNSCLKDQMPLEIKLSHKVPVAVTYMLAGIDENKNLHFYQDVYGKMK